MLRIDYTDENVFGFNGPNLCFLGNEDDFRKLALAISDLTTIESKVIFLSSEDFIYEEDSKRVIFISKKNSNQFAKVIGEGILFELDMKIWERIFKYFVFLSWGKKTYYLNAGEDCFKDLSLDQDCNFICSSEF